uniref:hypothetical protein n=1 Tax=Burkholderia arboris TaxID=488730 RepID=UPI003BEECC7A
MAVWPDPNDMSKSTETLLTRDEYEAWRKQHPEYEAPDFPTKKGKGSPLGAEGPKKGNNLGKLQGPVAKSAAPAAKANPPAKAETPKEKGWWAKAGGWVHGGLDVLGAIPEVGAVFDGANALIYTAEGDYAQAAISGGAAALDLVPGVGTAGKVGEFTVKGAAKLGAKEVTETVVKKEGKELAEKGAEQLGEDAGKTEGKGAAKAEEQEAEEAAKGKKKKEDEGGKADRDKCRLYPYKPDRCKKLGKTGHHVVADRAFRLPGDRTGSGRKQLPGGISEGDGLVICLEGANRSPTSEHGKAHLLYDAAELGLGKLGKPPGTTELLKLEIAGAAAVAAVTGCNALKIEAQLRLYHQEKGMGPDFKVRADPTGAFTKGKTFEDLMPSGPGDL